MLNEPKTRASFGFHIFVFVSTNYMLLDILVNELLYCLSPVIFKYAPAGCKMAYFFHETKWKKKKVTIKPRMVLLLVFFFLYENSVVECAGGGLPSRMPKDIFFIKTKKLKMLLLTFLLFVVNKAGRCIYCQHFKICPHTPHQIGVPKMKKPQKYQKSHQVFPFCSQI